MSVRASYEWGVRFSRAVSACDSRTTLRTWCNIVFWFVSGPGDTGPHFHYHTAPERARIIRGLGPLFEPPYLTKKGPRKSP